MFRLLQTIQRRQEQQIALVVDLRSMQDQITIVLEGDCIQ